MTIIRAGADVKARNEDGFTPAWLAEAEGHAETALAIQGKSLPRAEGYWVYEDKVGSRARVHKEACRYCKGPNSGDINTHEKEWHGPYASRDEAFRMAQATGRREVVGCRVCRP